MHVINKIINQRTDPNHVELSQFPTDCRFMPLHTSRLGWCNILIITIPNSDFPLTGAAHVLTTIPCVNHVVIINGYTGTSTDCYACHTTDYNNTTNPNHTAVSFPTTCVDCHSTTAWAPATFDHDNQYFPIYSGST